ncbi:MAG: excinuclease ABC subunit UvrA [Clostridia bacterium]|nr:excinuclease ABC subunit UvrA [Clostridia bacterium]
MASSYLRIRGARVHNLKNIDLDIPRDKLVVFTGLSGSGKSSLAFDTIYAEGHRRFVESLSSYARQFLGQLDKPDVDLIEGLSPSISIDQKTTSKNPRSTVGTVTEIYDYLRLLYARVGVPHCPVCGREIRRQTVDQIIEKIMMLDEGTRFLVLSPVVREKKGMHEKVFSDAQRGGYTRVRVDGSMYDLGEDISLDKNRRHSIEIVVDRLIMRDGIRPRLADSVETALSLSDGRLIIAPVAAAEGAGTPAELEFSQAYACEEHGISFGDLEPRMFSFNNPAGACPECSGLGVTRRISVEKVIPDLSLSLRDGAVAVNGFKSLDDESWNGPLVSAVMQAHGISLDTPLSEYTEEQMNILLYGTGSETYDVTRYFGREGHRRSDRFPGIIPIIEQRMQYSGAEEYYEEFIEEIPCRACGGRRLNPMSLSVTVGGLPIDRFCDMSVGDALRYINSEKLDLTPTEASIVKDVLKENRARLGFLVSVGLDYLTLSRRAGSLSGGEAQRIRLATQIGSALTGVLYVLDEPSIGLHQRDNKRLISTLCSLRDLGNTVIVVEHDDEMMRSSDFLVDIGPGAGVNGGRIVAAGTPEEVARCEESVTGAYLSGRKSIPVPEKRRPGNGKTLDIYGARVNNLKSIDVKIPLGCFVCVSGVSGSGKSSLVDGVISPLLSAELNRARRRPGSFDRADGIDALDKVICIDQSPIGRTPRSNPATYTGLFGEIRQLFAKTQDAVRRGYGPGRFSFNVKGGRCEACSGDGVKKIEMHFLPDVYVKCDVCGGKKYNRDTLEVRYKGKNIYEVLEMTAEEGLAFFSDIPKIRRFLGTLCDVGLGYIKIGQASTTLSGGEAQRVKLATELTKLGTGNTFYILDEPTTGLHTEDVASLLRVLSRLVDAGNTVLVIEHNLDVLKTADWIIDLGPEGGDAGGNVVACGTPEDVAKCGASYTGQFLDGILKKEKNGTKKN